MASSLALSAAAAAGGASLLPAKPHVSAKIIGEFTSAVPGSTVTLALDFTIEKKWHIYSTSRNDNGFPPKAVWELPAGFTVDAIQWPTPVRHVDPGDLLNHVYFDHVSLPVLLHVPSSAQPGSTSTIKAKLSWLVCDTSCVGEDAEVEFKLAIAKPGDSPSKSSDAKQIDEARTRLPHELAKDSKDISISWTATAVEVSVTDASRLIFHPDEDCVPFAAPIKDADVEGKKMTIKLGDPEEGHTALAGVLEIHRVSAKAGKSAEFVRIHSAPAAGPAKAEPAKPSKSP